MKKILLTIGLAGASVLSTNAQSNTVPQEDVKIPFLPKHSPVYSTNMPMEHVGSLSYSPETNKVSSFSDPETGLYYDFSKKEIRNIRSGNRYSILLEPRKKAPVIQKEKVPNPEVKI